MHEEQNHQRHLDARNRQRHHCVKVAQLHIGNRRGSRSQDQQCRPDQQVYLRADDVLLVMRRFVVMFRFSHSCLSIPYCLFPVACIIGVD